MYDHTDFTRNRALQTLQASLVDHVNNGLLLQEDIPAIMARIKVAPTLGEAVSEAAVVFEAVLDELVLKRELFQTMRGISDTALLTSNTIGLEVADISRGASGARVWGCRFLHPVWFVDDVEVTVGEPTNALSPTLRSLGLKPFYYAPGGHRRKLDDADLQRYISAQRDAVSAQRLQKPVAKRPDPSSRSQGAPAAEPCVVCLDAPRAALLVPCGHANTCMDCTMKLQPRICVECRQPIEKVLPWVPPAT